MKTNTYKQFKKWVVDTCHTNVLTCNEKWYIYEGDTAHAIYTAWYMFKHNFTEEQVNEYIHKDIEKTRKHFYSHGFNVSLNNCIIQEKPEEERILIKLKEKNYSGDSEYHMWESGGHMFEYNYLQPKWEKIVKTIWEYWEFKKLEEMEANDETK